MAVPFITLSQTKKAGVANVATIYPNINDIHHLLSDGASGSTFVDHADSEVGTQYTVSQSPAAVLALASSNTLPDGGSVALSIGTGGGAVPLTNTTVLLTTTAAGALTLADGYDGQALYIEMVAHTGDATLTPTNKNGFSTITFTAVGSGVHLKFSGGKWNIFGNRTVTIA